jgi:hypothetical protein
LTPARDSGSALDIVELIGYIERGLGRGYESPLCCRTMPPSWADPERPRKNMPDYRVETKVSSDGSLTLKGLPFQAGDEVEVIICSLEHGE